MHWRQTLRACPGKHAVPTWQSGAVHPGPADALACRHAALWRDVCGAACLIGSVLALALFPLLINLQKCHTARILHVAEWHRQTARRRRDGILSRLLRPSVQRSPQKHLQSLGREHVGT